LNKNELKTQSYGTNKKKIIEKTVSFSLQKTIEQQKRRILLAMEGKIEWEGTLDEMRNYKEQ
jgi:hypothetical protein